MPGTRGAGLEPATRSGKKKPSPVSAPTRTEALVILGTRVAEARHRACLTQQALADMVGAHRVEIANIERGSREPGALRLARIAVALGTTSDALVN